jgi:thiamine pyrophosphate-dependent acetolactate synthase large subunit-like protein
MVALGGAVAVADRLKSIHQTLNSVEVCKPVTKYSAEIDSSGATAEVLSAAFRAAESGRPGAAFVSLPMDIVTGEAKCNPIQLSNCRNRLRRPKSCGRNASRGGDSDGHKNSPQGLHSLLRRGQESSIVGSL